VLFLHCFSLVTVHEGLQPLASTSRQTREEFSLPHFTSLGLMHSKAYKCVGLGYVPVQLGAPGARRREQPCSWSCVCSGALPAKGPEGTLGRVPGPKPQPLLAAKRNRFSLVDRVVSRTAALNSARVKPASFMLRGLQTQGYLPTYQHPE